MTREEAIHYAECLKNNWTINLNDMEEFYDMAIESLSADAVEIVHCSECKYWRAHKTWSECTLWSADPYETAKTYADDFCSYGERKDMEIEQLKKTIETSIRRQNNLSMEKVEVKLQLNECINELCLKCGQYRTEHLGSCDDCKWYKMKRGEC